ncbi:MAG TPA: DUF1192 family protein [Alphaproteobacteria bacterium]|nr:DUF1192 family protein [Alphaproteobacteria bacterium]
MLMDDDLEPRTGPKKPKPLDGMSVEELRTYIDDLRAEIARAESALASKSAHLAAAAALFKQ